jgi:membrane-bound serine protease (ClpP class)
LPEPKGGQKDKQQGKQQQEGGTAAERKAINDVVAMLRSLAQLRGRSAEWAEKAVREAATLTADEALKEHVIEIVAPDLRDLLAQADGRKITVNGQERILATKDAALVTFTPDWRTQLLAVISDPNIAFILLMIGVYGILLEFWNPGTFVSGTVGAISLILALIALTILPVHYGALGLLLLGILLMIGEALIPGSVVLGVGGVPRLHRRSDLPVRGPRRRRQLRDFAALDHRSGRRLRRAHLRSDRRRHEGAQAPAGRRQRATDR